MGLDMIAVESKAESNAADARTRVMAVAMESFRNLGFRRSSMDAIAKSARMSKRTLYACFPDKHAVLEAVLTDFITRQFNAIGRLSTQSTGSRAALVTIGRELQRASNDDASLAMYRVLIAEADHMPALSDRTNRMGVAQVLELVRGPLHNLGIDDSATAARILYDLLVVAPLHKRLMNMEPEPIDIEDVIHLIERGMTGS